MSGFELKSNPGGMAGPNLQLFRNGRFVAYIYPDYDDYEDWEAFEELLDAVDGKEFEA